MKDNPDEKILPQIDSKTLAARRFARELKDRAFRYTMATGGVAVILAIVVIFLYLLVVVYPLFRPAGALDRASYASAAGSAPPLVLALDEYAEVAFAAGRDGVARFFSALTGEVLEERKLFPGDGVAVTAAAEGDPVTGVVAVARADGTAVVVRHAYSVSYPDNRRKITPKFDFPLGEAPLRVSDSGEAVRQLAVQSSADKTTLAAITEFDTLQLVTLTREASFLDDEPASVERSATRVDLPADAGEPRLVTVDLDQRELYVATGSGELMYFDIANPGTPKLVDRVHAAADGTSITALAMLSGGISVMVGDSAGRVTQWFPVRSPDNRLTLQRVRDFAGQSAAVAEIVPEHHRKGFAVLDETGAVGLYYATSHRLLLVRKVSDVRLSAGAFSPRADDLITVDERGHVSLLGLDNHHPEVSWQALWGRVWYESREGPEFIWQSSSASSDFEPKFSLTPLAFGTLKAAFFAMLFALPLAVMGAIYTAYFMAPGVRAMVKPMVELMAALPTVILGFLAGLWLAPLVESQLPGILLTIILLPTLTLVAAWLWNCMPAGVRHRVPDGWEALLLVPFICLAGVIGMAASGPIESAFFGGNMPQWVTQTLGLEFDQRNSLVVGIAMGFAVIPIIFSISEDAVFGVPKHLSVGSLALGATPWQTLVRVVLLTASPGIFSAVMIGLGRAVGETMIVLMATGNTPVMDINIFQGFRALSANIAVELPESEVASTHFRILFLAALVLFLMTFVFNTVAELVRQRLREKYSSL